MADESVIIDAQFKEEIIQDLKDIKQQTEELKQKVKDSNSSPMIG